MRKFFLVGIFLVILVCSCSSISAKNIKKDLAPLSCDPMTVPAQFMSYAKTKDFNKALDLANVCIKENPNYIQMYSNRGLIYRNMGKYDEALADFNTAISLDKNYMNAYYNRANLYMLKGDKKSASQELNRIIETNPQEYMAYNSRGLIKLEEKDIDGAMSDFKMAISINKDFPAYHNLGLLYLIKEDYINALKNFTANIKLAPQSADTYYYRGLCYMKTNQSQKAVNDLIIAAKLFAQAGDKSRSDEIIKGLREAGININ